jgi:hypothetical protein
VTGSRTIAKLEALLLRVRSRATEPRAARAIATGLAPVLELTVDPPIDEEDDQPTLPPPPITGAVQEEGVPLDIDVTVEEAHVAVAARAADSPVQAVDSRDRLVVALPVPEVVAEEASTEVEGAPVAQKVGEEVEDEEPPVSSRRPVMPEPEERLAEMAFGAEEPSPPRHSAPPESGRLPAVAAASFDAVDAVNAAVESPPRELAPEAIRGDLASSAGVIDVIGEAQRFAPSTFGALLDASLAL